jgi:hypothetical protein
VRHLAGGVHNKTPAEIRALLPPEYRFRPVRRNAAATDEDDDEIDDELEEEEEEESLGSEDTTTEEETFEEEETGTEVSEAESFRTVSTVMMSNDPTPSVSRQASPAPHQVPAAPVVIRVDSNHINAIPGMEHVQSRQPSGSSVSEGRLVIDLDRRSGSEVSGVPADGAAAAVEDAGTLPPPDNLPTASNPPSRSSTVSSIILSRKRPSLRRLSSSSDEEAALPNLAVPGPSSGPSVGPGAEKRSRPVVEGSSAGAGTSRDVPGHVTPRRPFPAGISDPEIMRNASVITVLFIFVE